MNPIVVIPARLGATRLPAKPLADICGLPMIVRVLRQALAADVGPVVVAAGALEIVAVVERAGGRAVLTDPNLPSGSDRVHAALEIVDPEGRHDAVVNMQGDLPALDPAHIRSAVAALEQSGADIATLAAEITDAGERANLSVVKAVVAWEQGGHLGRALYFTRLPAPAGDGPLFHHVGLYAFCRTALGRFVALAPSALERREKLEQLRALEANMSIAVARVDSVPLSVDTEEDLARARAFFENRSCR
ncbi:MAG: 3-deoxy-manno-octulosonate cytidylyltransferase [Rhizomicrobium sp.]